MQEFKEQIRVLIADDDRLVSRRLADYLSAHGFDVRLVTTGREAWSVILEWQPRFVLADIMLADMNALEIVDAIKDDKTLKRRVISVIVMSRHNTENNVRQAIQRGAKDYVVKPFKQEDIMRRLVFHARSYRQIKEISSKDYLKVDEASLLLHLTALMLRQALGSETLQQILFNLTRMVSLKVDGVRCSVIHCLDQKAGVVVSSNDDFKASGIQLDLYNYPEVLHVLNTQNAVAIENVDQNPELQHVLEKVKDINFNSMIVSPVKRFGKPFGVLSLRLPKEKLRISDNEIRFVEIVSHVVSLVLSNEIHKKTEDFWLQGDPRGVLVLPFQKSKNS